MENICINCKNWGINSAYFDYKDNEWGECTLTRMAPDEFPEHENSKALANGHDNDFHWLETHYDFGCNQFELGCNQFEIKE